MLRKLIVFLFIVPPIVAIQSFKDNHRDDALLLYPNSEIQRSVYNILGCLSDLGVPNDTNIHVFGDDQVEIYLPSRMGMETHFNQLFNFCHRIFPLRIIFMSTFAAVDEYSGREVGSLEDILKGDVLLPEIKLAKTIPPYFSLHGDTSYAFLVIKKYWYRILNGFLSSVHRFAE